MVNVTAPGLLAQTRDVQVAEGATQELAFELEPEPKQRLVEVKENKIELLQQVQLRARARRQSSRTATRCWRRWWTPSCATTSSACASRATRTTRATAELNLQLSKDRAKAVADHLIKAGIDASRLEVEGYGDTRPIAPNLTPRGRELNRRVEFVILER